MFSTLFIQSLLLFASVLFILPTIIMIAPMQHDCLRWLTDENLILPIDETQIDMVHTFITPDGTMLVNPEYGNNGEGDKDVCTKSLHRHLDVGAVARRRLQNSTTPSTTLGIQKTCSTQYYKECTEKCTPIGVQSFGNCQIQNCTCVKLLCYKRGVSSYADPRKCVVNINKNLTFRDCDCLREDCRQAYPSLPGQQPVYCAEAYGSSG